MKNIFVPFLIAIFLCSAVIQVYGQLVNTSGIRVNEYNKEGNSDKSGVRAEANAQGFKTILWLDSRNDKNALFAQILDGENQMIQSNFQVSGDLEEVSEYDVDVSNDNRSIITWRSRDELNNSSAIFYQMFDQNGIKIFDKKIVPPQRPGLAAGESPAVAFLDDGSFVIAMQKFSFESFDEYVSIQKFDQLGESVSDEVVVHEFDGFRESVDVAANSNRILIVFDKDAIGESNDVLFTTLDTSLNILTPPNLIQANNSADQFNPQVDKFSDQSFIASWIDESSDTKGEVKVQRFDMDGTITGPSKSLGVSSLSISITQRPYIETLGNEFMVPISSSLNTWKIYNQSLNQIASGEYPAYYGAPTIDRNGFGILYINSLNPPYPSIALMGVKNSNVDMIVNDDTLASDQFPVDIDVNTNGDGVIAFKESGYLKNLFTYQLVNSNMELIGPNQTISNAGTVGFVRTAMADDGTFALLWRHTGDDPTYYVRGYIQFFDNSGQAITDSIRMFNNTGGTISGFFNGLVYNPSSNRYLSITGPRKGGDNIINISIFNKSGQRTKQDIELLETSAFTKVLVEVTPSGDFIIGYYTSLSGGFPGEKKLYYSRLSSLGELLEKNKTVFSEINTIEDHFLMQSNNTTYFVWRSNQDSVGPDKINEPIMIRGLSEQGTLGNISYLDVSGELFSVLNHKGALKIFTEENNQILVTNFEEGGTSFQTIPFLSMKEYTQDEFEWVAEDGKMHVAYQTFIEKGRGLDVVYDILEDQDEDGFFEQTDCNDSLSNINPLALEIPNNDVDENCDGIIEREDLDNDGYVVGEDCNDMDSLINPGQMEIPYNGKDDDCDSLTFDDDLDRDGFLLADDCNDMDPDVNPDAMEIPNNGIDENCDGMDSTTNVLVDRSDQVTLYPNPAQEIIQIKGLVLQDHTIKVFGPLGKEYLVLIENDHILLENYPVGMFWVMMENNLTHNRIIKPFMIIR